MMPGRPSDERGIALIAALWALLLLSAIGSSVALVARERSWFAGSHGERAAARWAAEAALASAEARLSDWAAGLATLPQAGSFGAPALDSASAAQRRVWLVALNAMDSLLAARATDSLPNGARYGLEVRDATARLNLNAAAEPELRAFFRRWIRDERALSILVHSLLDWRDEDDLARAQGAEADYYRQLPTPYAIRNGPLLSVEELLLVRGMTPELLREIEPLVTMLPLTELRVNLNAAPVEVLAAVPGFSPELAERVAARRLRAGPVLSAAELASDPELGPLFDRGAGAQAINAIALYPEVVEIVGHGWGPGGGAAHRVQVLYTLHGGALRCLQRSSFGP